MLKIQINKPNSFKELSEEDQAIFEPCGFMPNKYAIKAKNMEKTIFENNPISYDQNYPTQVLSKTNFQIKPSNYSND